ncbi:MAG: hypothetical protein NTX13_22625 [Acidobacteria bacterium]|nr:hypothetical protein [Acidobacteriota bacterium]
MSGSRIPEKASEFQRQAERKGSTKVSPTNPTQNTGFTRLSHLPHILQSDLFPRLEPERGPLDNRLTLFFFAAAGQLLCREDDAKLPVWSAPAIPSFTDCC